MTRGKGYKDFGKGFYATSVKSHAENIARRNKRILETREAKMRQRNPKFKAKISLEQFSELMNQAEGVKEQAEDIVRKSDALYSKLTDDLSKDVVCSEVHKGVRDIVELTKSTTLGIDLGEGYWDMVIERYSQENVKIMTDQKYGNGAAEYIAKAFRYYFDHVNNS